MRLVARLLAGEIEKAARGFPALIVTGPRRAGKTTLLRRMFARAPQQALRARLHCGLA